MAKLDNLKKQLEKIGVSFTLEKFGANYFQNAEPLFFDGFCITFSFPADNGKESIVKRHLDRYGFSVLWAGGFPGVHYLHVVSSDSKNAYDLYNYYQGLSVAACEKYIHLHHEGFYSDMSDREFNAYLAGVMEYYGEQYNEAKKEMEVA